MAIKHRLFLVLMTCSKTLRSTPPILRPREGTHKTTQYRSNSNSRASIWSGGGLVPQHCIPGARNSVRSTIEKRRFLPESVSLQRPYLGATGSF